MIFKKSINVKTVDMRKENIIVNAKEKVSYSFPAKITMEIYAKKIIIYDHRTYVLKFSDIKTRKTFLNNRIIN